MWLLINFFRLSELNGLSPMARFFSGTSALAASLCPPAEPRELNILVANLPALFR
jgi:hypothetical protein